MPIYAYRCEACGFAKDVLQKMSDAPLTDCLACGKPAFKKQLTAAGFQLKGSGWYVTDFRGGASTTAAPAVAEGAKSESAKSESAPAASAKADSSASTSSSASTAPAAASSGSTPTAS